jgi:hypothetical protein
VGFPRSGSADLIESVHSGSGPATLLFMYLRAILCTFQISVDFYYVPMGGRGGAGEGGARESGIECILYGYN